ncbi:hypothetical protein HMPREF1349_02338, partial [Enterococcus faecium 506]
MDIQEFPQNDVVGDSILPEILYVFLFFYKKTRTDRKFPSVLEIIEPIKLSPICGAFC